MALAHEAEKLAQHRQGAVGEGMQTFFHQHSPEGLRWLAPLQREAGAHRSAFRVLQESVQLLRRHGNIRTKPWLAHGFRFCTGARAEADAVCRRHVLVQQVMFWCRDSAGRSTLEFRLVFKSLVKSRTYGVLRQLGPRLAKSVLRGAGACPVCCIRLLCVKKGG